MVIFRKKSQFLMIYKKGIFDFLFFLKNTSPNGENLPLKKCWLVHNCFEMGSNFEPIFAT
jgi:hypothetical protein